MPSLHAHLLEFGSRAGMGPLALNDDGVCRLVFDREFIVDLELRDGEACLSGVVGTAEDLAPGTLRYLLAANLLGDETGGAALAVDDAEDAVVLCRRVPLDGLSYAAFEGSLTAFVDAQALWRARLDALAAGTDAPSEPALDGEMQIFRA